MTRQTIKYVNKEEKTEEEKETEEVKQGPPSTFNHFIIKSLI